MATLPPIKIKNFGQYGIITDQPPADLPNNAFSYGSNVRFIDGKVTRSPVMRRVFTPDSLKPAHVAAVTFTSGFDRLYSVGKDFSITEYESGAEWDVTPVSWGTGEIESSFSSANLSDVLFINRPDRVPVYKSTAVDKFTVLPGWDSAWRTGLIRSYKNALIALNFTKAGVSHPQGVMWSDFVLAGGLPEVWGAAPENSAGENDLAEMTGPIVEAQVLRDTMFLYSHHDVWRMDYVGGNDVFAFNKAFGGIGALNTNCAVEVEGKHYVLGTNDIYVHDGNSYKSIADGRVKEFYLRTLNSRKANRAFVFHAKRWKEVYFCYTAGGDTVSYPKADGCNRALVYNYQSDTWSIMDLPNVFSASAVNIEVSYLWGPHTNEPQVQGEPVVPIAAPGTWDSMGGSWYDLEDTYERHVVIASQKLDALDAPEHERAVYALDTVYSKTAVPFLIDPIASLPPFVRRDYIDLDEDGDTLSANRVLNKVLPQGRTFGNEDVVLKWKIGSSLYPAGQVKWKQTDVPFRHENQYKIDSRASGRYLSYEVTMPTYDDFELSSMDVITTTTARR